MHTFLMAICDAAERGTSELGASLDHSEDAEGQYDDPPAEPLDGPT
jgi:hypothetical protein